MRSFVLLLLATLLVAGSASAQPEQRISIQTGETKSVIGSKLNIKFVGIVEDSRCPKGTTCIWAGNAKVSIRVWKKNQKPNDFELNSTLDPHSVEFMGYQITLAGLSPKTEEGDTATNKKINTKNEIPPGTAIFEIVKVKS